MRPSVVSASTSGCTTAGRATWWWSFAFAAVYVAASRRIRFLTQQPVVAGAVFGFLVFFFMRLIVLPLSAFPFPVTFKPLATVLDLASHMFLFGVPIALAARKAAG